MDAGDMVRLVLIKVRTIGVLGQSPHPLTYSDIKLFIPSYVDNVAT